jgi:hypothetical protein
MTHARPAVVVLLVLTCVLCSGCLVLSVNPAYDDSSIGWDPNLVGNWIDADDNTSLQIERSEWKSYRIHYVHPSENGDLTGYLTFIGDDRYLDVMPARGEDRGSFLIPVHAVLRVRLDGDRLELSALSYDWFFEHVRGGRPIPGLSVALDQKQNALILSPVDRLRDWLRVQSADSPAFGAPATFTRKAGQP